ncbi:hypothetical protein NA56DRAFT_711166 [Hyaloscypha hepaticicola]|uniref:Fungal-type protein kinase domain-containing protein n=1 Tax=Hyaloscypha hepaticicola TaxID=2082293 RepID=A0A2J6PJW1_9HELO|nr:hypothetical protein NA56DRAFT_711166 [Hyaloscypha hepaticicola]
MVDSLADCRNQWQRNNVDSIQEAGADSPIDCESETYSNRVHYCLVTSLVGRPLHEYQSVKELLKALRDAIRGYRSLLEDGKILYQDISENNIIITELLTKEAPKGRLIDLDLIEELDRDMGKNRFENIIVEFALKFKNLKPLARELRSTLFPIRDGDIFTSTFHDHDIMYDGMINAFNVAISHLGQE